MSRAVACCILTLIWAIIYLTNLGSSELRSEEGHRVLPAVQMLESGNYLVPYIANRPYLNKPPLINWIVAGSFPLFHARNEWTARLPSALAILVVTLTLFLVSRRLLGFFGSFAGALCWLTNLGLIEKGRMIEIEAIYCSLFALAFLCWLILWQQGRSPWLTFILPSIFLGFGLLAKGPSHIFFFYALLTAILWQTRRLRDLVHPAHALGLFVMLGIFLLWAIPCFHALPGHSLWKIWSQEAANAVHGEEGRSEDWALNFPRGLAYFLPWLLLIPFLRPGKVTNLFQQALARGLIWGMLLPFLLVLLIPGTLPRYILPLLAPFSWLIGLAIAHDAFAWKIGNFSLPRPLIYIFVALGIVAAMVIYPLRSVTYLKRHERLKPIAARLNAILPSATPLYVIDPDYQPFLFYLRVPITYLSAFDQLPPDARYFLLQPKYQRQLENGSPWINLNPKLLAQTESYRRHETMLFLIQKQP